MNAIEISKLTKKYGDKKAVDSLDLTVKKGELFALLGVNGAGKTTTIKMLSCLSKPDEGDALLMGHSILSSQNQVKKYINVSPQETAVASKLSVMENLMLIAQLYGFSKDEAIKRCEAVMKEFGLDEVSQQLASTLSGGWKRRLSIALALISEPAILFLDEPTLGLDVIARRTLWSQIEKLKGEVTVVLTTHYLQEAEHLADRIGVMADGHLCAVGTADELKELTGALSLEDAFVSLASGGGAL